MKALTAYPVYQLLEGLCCESSISWFEKAENDKDRNGRAN